MNEFGWRLREAAQTGNLEKLQRELESGTPVDCTSYSSGKVGAVFVFSSVSSFSALRQTSLHEAAEAGHLDVVRLLLERGANVEAKDAAGETPLHLAVAQGRDQWWVANEAQKDFARVQASCESGCLTHFFSSSFLVVWRNCCEMGQMHGRIRIATANLPTRMLKNWRNQDRPKARQCCGLSAMCTIWAVEILLTELSLRAGSRMIVLQSARRVRYLHGMGRFVVVVC